VFFKHKPKNRRLGREHVLDVKLRSSQVRAARTRRVGLAVAFLLALVLGGYVTWRTGHWAMNRLIYENSAFAIENLDIQTDGILSLGQLRRWAGIKPGQNLLALDLARVKRDLEMVSTIQTASVERVLPHTLRLRITEREPVAQINVHWQKPGGGLETSTFHLDSEGWVMLPVEPGQRATPPASSDPLPLVSGLNGNEIQPGRRLESPQLRAALQLIAAFEHSPMAGLVDLHSIDISSLDVLVLTTEQGSEVTFGFSDLDQQLRRWRAIFDRSTSNKLAITSLDLAVNTSIPARLADASGLPPVTPRPPKPIHTRKKHV